MVFYIHQNQSVMRTKKNTDQRRGSNSGIGSRRDFIKTTSMGGVGMGLLFNGSQRLADAGWDAFPSDSNRAQPSSGIFITDLRCAVIGNHPVVRIVTNAGISGYAQIEPNKNWIKPVVLFYKDWIIGMDPTDVERVMLKIRRMGGFKPWGAAISAIEMALWDIAGKAAGVPVYKLLGGKVRDKVRPYGRSHDTPEEFSIVKMGIGLNSRMPFTITDFYYGTPQEGAVMPVQNPNPYGYDPKTQTYKSKTAPRPNRGTITEKGLKAMIMAVEEKKKELGDTVGLAVECATGFMVADAIRLAQALEPYNLLWMEDLLTGDYHPYVLADLYREVTQSTSTPIHTGEQIYLRQNFRELFETNAINVVGPDPADMGGIAEMKWVAEYADLHGIQIAPHGVGDGVFGIAAHVQAGAVMPENFIAFEYPAVRDEWWFEITEGLPDPIVNKGLIEVWDKPGIGVDFIVKAAKKYLPDEDKGFFD
jgi:L-alanine-DL-glutamate epimerase-like enolase superfamily enzyme